jgi:hypothetical protein
MCSKCKDAIDELLLLILLQIIAAAASTLNFPRNRWKSCPVSHVAGKTPLNDL